MATRCCSLFVLFIYCFVYFWNHAMGLFGMKEPKSFAYRTTGRSHILSFWIYHLISLEDDQNIS